MKKTLILMLFLLSISAFSQVRKDSLKVNYKGPNPIVETQTVITVTKVERGFEVVTKLYILRQGQNFFEIFAKWENLARQLLVVDEIKKYHQKQVEKEIKIIGNE